MSTRGIAGKVATVAMGVVMAAGIGAPTAFAGTNDCASIDGNAKGCFHHKGDWFSLKDTAGDGSAVYLEYEVEKGPSGRLDNNEGSGQTKKRDLEIKEGQTVRYRVCINDEPGFDSCSVWHDATA